MPAPSSQPDKYSAEEVASLGDEIYERKIRSQVEPDHKGEIVAIDVESGAFVVDKTVLAAADRLLARSPSAEIWCVRVGHRALHHVGARSILGPA